jgi:hypothetical protein
VYRLPSSCLSFPSRVALVGANVRFELETYVFDTILSFLCRVTIYKKVKLVRKYGQFTYIYVKQWIMVGHKNSIKMEGPQFQVLEDGRVTVREQSTL